MNFLEIKSLRFVSFKTKELLSVFRSAAGLFHLFYERICLRLIWKLHDLISVAAIDDDAKFIRCEMRDEGAHIM